MDLRVSQTLTLEVGSSALTVDVKTQIKVSTESHPAGVGGDERYHCKHGGAAAGGHTAQLPPRAVGTVARETSWMHFLNKCPLLRLMLNRLLQRMAARP